MVPHHFQIICNSTGSIVNNPPYTPASPSPSNGSTEISITTIFNWVGGDPDPDDTVTYNVYFGTNSIPPLVINNQSITTYNPGTLNYDTRYYWRITTWDNHGDYAEGPIWHFTTEYKTPPTQYNKPPIADANGPYKGYINQTITFDGSKSYDTDGVIEYYRWDFNYDGSWDTEWIESETITYVYSNAGNYTVSLEVKDDKQATDTHTSLITILPIKDGEIPPVANANGPYLGHINQNITFNASGSYDMDGTIINYNWDFGDGITNSSMNPTHVYTINGTYTVILVVIDKSGLTDTDKTTSYIFILDTDEDGWGDNEEKKYGTDPNNPKDYPLDSDNDHIPDFEDTDDDNDGLSDTLEGKLGSNLKNKSDVESISINGITHFLVDTDEDSKIDLFYNSSSGKITYIYYKDKNQYLIDDDGDGQWDYIYDTAGALSPYIEEKTSHPSNMSFIIFPLLIIILIVAIFVIIIKVGYRKS
jgi:PKD repeat protein